jgi:hypothetical protein
LAGQILFRRRKKLARQQGGAVGFLRDEDHGDGASEREFLDKQVEEALADLCAVYGTSYPLSGVS